MSSTVIRELSARLTLEAKDFNNGLRAAQQETTEFQKVIKPTTTLLRDMGSAAATAGKALTVAVTAPIAAAMGLGISFNAMQEQATVAFTTMLGSAEKAQSFLSEMKDFAAKTPFEFPDLVTAAKRMMAYGFAAEQVRPVLTAVGNAGAALGGGAEALDRITTALGQIKAKGTVQAEEMRQLAEAGIPAWEILAQKLGVTIPEAMKLVENRAVSATDAISALTEGMNAKFGGMMEKQATTFSGLVSTIKDESRFLAGELTEGLFNSIKGPALAFTGVLHDLRVGMEGWSDATKTTVTGIGLLAAGIGPATFIVGTMAGSVTNLIGLYTTLSAMWVKSGATLAGLVAAGGPYVVAATALAGLAFEVWNLHNAWAASIDSQGEATTALARQEESTIKAAKSLKDKYGIDIKRAGMSTTEWGEALSRAAMEAGKVERAADALAPKVKTVAQLTEEVAGMQTKAAESAKEMAAQQSAAAEAADALARAEKSIKDNFIASLRPSDELWKTIDSLNDSFKNEDIVKVYGDRILAVNQEQRDHGKEINKYMQDLEALVIEYKKLATAADEAAEAAKKAKEAIKPPAATTGLLNPSEPDPDYNPFDPFGLNKKNAEMVARFKNPTSNIASQPALPAALNLGSGDTGSGPGGSFGVMTGPAGGYSPAGWVNGRYFAESGRPQGTSSLSAPISIVNNFALNTSGQVDQQFVTQKVLPWIQDALSRGIGLEELVRQIKAAWGGIASTKGA